MRKPSVVIITPTWNRHERLLNRCIPSVQAQAYPRVDHWIISDGPDEVLADKLVELAGDGAFYHPVHYLQLPEHSPEPHWGHFARLAGIKYSDSELIGYIDDDDLLRPEHCAKLAGVLANETHLGFAYSLMESHSNSGLSTHIGTDPPFSGQIGTPMIMHRRQILEAGTWGPASSIEDWELVQRWLNAGVNYKHLPEPTVDVWPSAYWG